MQEERWERQQKQVSAKKVEQKGLEWRNAGFPSTRMESSLQKITSHPSMPEKLFQIALDIQHQGKTEHQGTTEHSQ